MDGGVTESSILTYATFVVTFILKELILSMWAYVKLSRYISVVCFLLTKLFYEETLINGNYNENQNSTLFPLTLTVFSIRNGSVVTRN